MRLVKFLTRCQIFFQDRGKITMTRKTPFVKPLERINGGYVTVTTQHICVIEDAGKSAAGSLCELAMSFVNRKKLR